MIGILAALAFAELLLILFLAALVLLLYLGLRGRTDEAETARTERDAARVDREELQDRLGAALADTLTELDSCRELLVGDVEDALQAGGEGW